MADRQTPRSHNPQFSLTIIRTSVCCLTSHSPILCIDTRLLSWTASFLQDNSSPPCPRCGPMVPIPCSSRICRTVFLCRHFKTSIIPHHHLLHHPHARNSNQQDQPEGIDGCRSGSLIDKNLFFHRSFRQMPGRSFFLRFGSPDPMFYLSLKIDNIGRIVPIIYIGHSFYLYRDTKPWIKVFYVIKKYQDFNPF